MVLDMGGGPVQGGSLKGHGTADQEEATDPAWRFETLVGQHPMIANCNSKSAKNVSDHKQGEISTGDHSAPEANDGIDCG